MSEFRQTHSKLRNENLKRFCSTVLENLQNISVGIKGTVEHNLGIVVTSEYTGLTLNLFSFLHEEQEPEILIFFRCYKL